ncbi:hypothetical protein [Flavobacterium sp. '19STA2R22 D10 B1']|uniref:hypothetical protein n=1 Tax=Flavobacterium aerium TaxID=3037261 RepID=UPI00278C4927|nr:hypothetical protein [Flavobacterium sp. '19STA2R22 D10 B1']
MKRLFDIFFTGYCLLWLVVHLLRHIKQPLPFFNSYLTDCIAVPVIAHIAIIFTRKFVVKNQHYTYPLSYLLFIATYTSILFEWIMPQFSSKYTADGLDVLCYFGGALFYYFIHNKRDSENSRSFISEVKQNAN